MVSIVLFFFLKLSAVLSGEVELVSLSSHAGATGLIHRQAVYNADRLLWIFFAVMWASLNPFRKQWQTVELINCLLYHENQQWVDCFILKGYVTNFFKTQAAAVVQWLECLPASLVGSSWNRLWGRHFYFRDLCCQVVPARPHHSSSTICLYK